jgi:hypothetical protein
MVCHKRLTRFALVRAPSHTSALHVEREAQSASSTLGRTSFKQIPKAVT